MQVKLFTIRMDANYLEIDQNSLNDFLENVAFKKSDTHFIESESSCWSVLIQYEELLKVESKSSLKEDIQFILSESQEVVLQRLKNWRNDKASELGLKHFLICHNSELVNIAINHPKTLNDLKAIKGFGDLKFNKYGAEIIEVLSNF